MLQPRSSYKVAIVGAGTHGLSIAYNLVKRGVEKVAVFDKGYVGGGATTRNAGIVRPGFSSPEWIAFMRENIGLWEQLSKELDFNVLFSQRGYLGITFTERMAHVFKESVEKVQRPAGINNRFLTPAEIKELVPEINLEGITAGLLHPRGGIARHDAVAWGFERAAKAMGAEIFPFTEVTGVEVQNGKVHGLHTTRGYCEAEFIVDAAAGHSKIVAAMAGVDIPIKTYRLQALVTESLKPFLNPAVITYDRLPIYTNQTDRGEIIAGADVIEEPSFNLTCTLGFLEDVAKTMVSLFPRLAGVAVQRQWSGLIDVTPDYSPILGTVGDPEGFICDCGWGGYGFNSTPLSGRLTAELIATGHMPPLIWPFRFSRFAEGKTVQEYLTLERF